MVVAVIVELAGRPKQFGVLPIIAKMIGAGQQRIRLWRDAGDHRPSSSTFRGPDSMHALVFVYPLPEWHTCHCSARFRGVTRWKPFSQGDTSIVVRTNSPVSLQIRARSSQVTSALSSKTCKRTFVVTQGTGRLPRE